MVRVARGLLSVVPTGPRRCFSAPFPTLKRGAEEYAAPTARGLMAGFSSCIPRSPNQKPGALGEKQILRSAYPNRTTRDRGPKHAEAQDDTPSW